MADCLGRKLAGGPRPHAGEDACMSRESPADVIGRAVKKVNSLEKSLSLRPTPESKIDALFIGAAKNILLRKRKPGEDELLCEVATNAVKVRVLAAHVKRMQRRDFTQHRFAIGWASAKIFGEPFTATKSEAKSTLRNLLASCPDSGYKIYWVGDDDDILAEANL